jgi:hypothetical protein
LFTKCSGTENRNKHSHVCAAASKEVIHNFFNNLDGGIDGVPNSNFSNHNVAKLIDSLGGIKKAS